MARKTSSTQALAQVFRLLGDPSRLRVVTVLLEGPFNVTQICRRLRMSQPTVSRHLSILKMSQLAEAQRNGKEIFYSMSTETKRVIKSLIERAGSLGR